MVSWWDKYSYFNNEQIQISDVELMNHEYGSLQLFGFRVRSNMLDIIRI